jgi:hypothetical protein
LHCLRDFGQIDSMNATQRFVTKLIAALAVLLGAACTAQAQAPTATNGAQVRGLLGRAKYSTAGGPFAELTGGTTLHAGDRIQTASGSALDLYLGPSAGTVRLAESTTVSIEKLAVTDGAFDIELALRNGELLGKGHRVPPGSKLVIKNATGFGAVLEGHFRFDARGHVVLLEGKIIFVQIGAKGSEPVPYHLNAPPAVYWSPAEGMKLAPSALTREVNNQTRSKLPKG